MTPSIYQEMYEKAKEDDSDLVCCGYDRISSEENDTNEIVTLKRYRFYAMYHSGHSVYEYPSLLIEASCYLWNKLYRKELLKKICFPVGQKYEDSAVIYNTMEMANKISLVNKVGYYYRVLRDGSITKNYNGVWDIFKSMDSFLNYYRGIGKEELFRDEINHLCFRHLLYARNRQFEKASLSFVIRYFVKAFRYLNRNCPDWKKNKYFYQNYTLYSPKYEQKHLLYYNSVCFVLYYILKRIYRIVKPDDMSVKIQKNQGVPLEKQDRCWEQSVIRVLCPGMMIWILPCYGRIMRN